MDFEEVKKVFERIGEANIRSWDAVDQLRFAEETIKFAKGVKPLLDKYDAKTSSSTLDFLRKLIEEEHKNDR